MTREELNALTTDLGQELGVALEESDLQEMERKLANCFLEIFELEIKES